MRLVNLDDCNRDLFYEQMGGKNSLITVKTAFDMLMTLPAVNIDARDALYEQDFKEFKEKR